MNYDFEPRRPRPAPETSGATRSLLLVVLGMLLAGGALWGLDAYRARQAEPLNDPDARPREAAPAVPLDRDEAEAVDLFKKVKGSVVNVDLVQQVRRAAWDDRPAEQPAGTGSGFVWDDAGRIVTNYHVIEAATRRPDLTVRVVLADRTAYEAVLVGADPGNDLAVLQFAPHNRPPKDKVRKIAVGTSADLEVGQKAYAIGNPYGLSLTMTKGIISALNRSIKSAGGGEIHEVIQTDAPINPGNSGGPLLDKAGRLIGVNTAIASAVPNGGNVGIGFAIPVDTVNQVVTQIIQSGRVLRPDLGVKLFDQQRLRRARYDHGVMVESVVPNGPAAKAGLRGVRVDPRAGKFEPGDLIVGVNDQVVDTVEDFQRAVRGLKPGETAKVKVVRKDGEQEVTLTVGGA
ncbi:MAG: 2-alkenal reductase [Isosphaera sp.]|nr:2-alkenal reductase [Isosphaera sp.]